MQANQVEKNLRSSDPDAIEQVLSANRLSANDRDLQETIDQCEWQERSDSEVGI